MNHFLKATLTASIELSDKDFDFIWNCCRASSDYSVKSCIQVGGFLYRTKEARTDLNITLSLNQINVILKSLESQDIKFTENALSIHNYLSNVIFEINAFQESINDRLKKGGIF